MTFRFAFRLPSAATSLLSSVRLLMRHATIGAMLLMVGHGICEAAGARLIKVSDGSQTWTGKIVAMDASNCSLIDRFGTIQRLPVQTLKSFEVVSDRYQPAPVTEIREQLRKEFPTGYEVTGSTHYLVCGPKGKSQAYVRLFDEIYRSVDQFFRVRGFSTKPPDTVLVAIVFGSQQEFAEYCRRDNVASSPGLRGYYSLLSNRVALFDDPLLLQTAATGGISDARVGTASPGTTGLPGVDWSLSQDWSFSQDGQTPADLIAASNGISGSAANTIIHEATHQVGHNIGIHSRITGTPTWIIEGLATTLESPGQRRGSAGKDLSSRVNAERLNWFNGEYAGRRQPGDIARLIASDDPFRNSTLDAYSSAWALTFFMAESPTRTQKFMKYLQQVSDRKPGAEYTAEERLKDFQDAFGDIARLEVEYLRFMDRL